MKLDIEKLDVEVSGIQQRQNYDIAVNAKMFKILSSGLYSNKIQSVIRELSCNCYDSHVEAGKKDLPFEVHLPNSLESYFSIRDFGTGMDENKIQTLYRTYGGSDKTKSNDLIGCMGIGSKSPFSMTNQFTITSWYGGNKMVYVSLISEEGIPQLNRFGIFPSKEPNGVEISFAVAATDFGKFKDEAQNIYKFFPCHPTIKGNPSYKQQTLPKFIFEDTDSNQNPSWKIATSQYQTYGNSNRSYAIMGNIAYPINKQHFDSNYQSYSKNAYSTLIDAGCYLYFNIGELEMTASREDLEYTPKVIDAVKKRLDKVKDSLGKIFSDELASQKDVWSARLFANNVQTKYYSGLFEIITKSGLLKFKGKQLNLGGVSFNIGVGTSGVNQYTHNPRRAKNNLSISLDTYYLYPSENIVFYKNDEPDKPVVRMAHYLESNSNKTLIVFSKAICDDAKKFTEYKELIGIDDSYFSDLSSLPLPPKKVRVPSGIKIDRSKIEAWKLDLSRFSTSHTHSWHYRNPNPGIYWTEEKVPHNMKQVYVEINQWYWSSGSMKSKSPSNLNEIFEKLKVVGITEPALYGIKTAKLERVQKLKWPTLEEWIKEEIKKTIKAKNLKNAIKDKECLNILELEDFYRTHIKKANVQPKQGPFKLFLDKVQAIKIPSPEVVAKIKELADEWGLTAELEDSTLQATVADLKKEEVQMKIKYPILDFVKRVGGLNSQLIDGAVKCINAFDECPCKKHSPQTLTP